METFCKPIATKPKPKVEPPKDEPPEIEPPKDEPTKDEPTKDEAGEKMQEDTQTAPVGNPENDGSQPDDMDLD